MAFVEMMLLYLTSFLIIALFGDSNTLIFIIYSVLYFCIVILIWPLLLLMLYDLVHYIVAAVMEYRKGRPIPGALNFLFGLYNK
jgi:hypothetical protein